MLHVGTVIDIISDPPHYLHLHAFIAFNYVTFPSFCRATQNNKIKRFVYVAFSDKYFFFFFQKKNLNCSFVSLLIHLNHSLTHCVFSLLGSLFHDFIL